MREIKFRGLTLDTKQWVYGYYLVSSEKHYIIDCHGVTGTALVLADSISALPGYHEVLPETVGQFTGLKDKNGKEIYERDILEWDKSCSLGDNPMCPFVIQVENLRGDRACMPYAKESHIAWEIIGTVHKNPELLEVER